MKSQKSKKVARVVKKLHDLTKAEETGLGEEAAKAHKVLTGKKNKKGTKDKKDKTRKGRLGRRERLEKQESTSTRSSVSSFKKRQQVIL